MSPILLVAQGGARWSSSAAGILFDLPLASRGILERSAWAGGGRGPLPASAGWGCFEWEPSCRRADRHVTGLAQTPREGDAKRETPSGEAVSERASDT